MHFRYRALDSTLTRISGELEARSLQHLEQELQRRGLEVISAKPGRSHRPRAVSSTELADFCQQTAQLLSAGIPLLDAMQDLGEGGEGTRLPALCRRLGNRLAGGAALSQALTDEGLAPAFVGVVRAGECSGRLAETLQRLGSGLSQEAALAASMRRALLQPLLAAGMVLTASLFLMLYLVPQIRTFLADGQQTLPLASTLLFATTDLLQQHWPWLGILPALPIATVGMQRRPALALAVDRLALRLPLTGTIHKKLLIARLAELLRLLYSSGIPLLDALRSMPASITNRHLAGIVSQIADDVEQGSSLTQAFARHPLFPRLMIRMLQVGERSGTLEQALQVIGRRSEQEAVTAISILHGLLGPALTLVIGLLLGWIMLATIQPLYGLIEVGLP